MAVDPDAHRLETALATEIPEPCDLHDYASELSPQLRQVLYLLEERMLNGETDSSNIQYFSNQLGVPVQTLRRMAVLIRQVWAVDTRTFTGATKIRDDVRAKLYAIHRRAIQLDDMKIAVLALDKIAEIDNLKNPTILVQNGSAGMITNVARENVMNLMDKMAALSTRKNTIAGESHEIAVIAHTTTESVTGRPPDAKHGQAKIIDIGLAEATLEPVEGQVVKAPVRPVAPKLTPGQTLRVVTPVTPVVQESQPAPVTAPTAVKSDPTKIKRSDPTKLQKKVTG